MQFFLSLETVRYLGRLCGSLGFPFSSNQDLTRNHLQGFKKAITGTPKRRPRRLQIADRVDCADSLQTEQTEYFFSYLVFAFTFDWFWSQISVQSYIGVFVMHRPRKLGVRLLTWSARSAACMACVLGRPLKRRFQTIVVMNYSR